MFTHVTFIQQWLGKGVGPRLSLQRLSSVSDQNHFRQPDHMFTHYATMHCMQWIQISAKLTAYRVGPNLRAKVRHQPAMHNSHPGATRLCFWQMPMLAEWRWLEPVSSNPSAGRDRINSNNDTLNIEITWNNNITSSWSCDFKNHESQHVICPVQVHSRPLNFCLLRSILW